MGPEKTYGSPMLTVPDYQWDDMRHYVRDCADIMGLRDYTCNYYKSKPDDLHGTDVMAAIDVCPRRRHFTIWLPLDWFHKAAGADNEREEARSTVAHELLHVHFKRIRDLPRSLQTNMGDHVWGVWNDIFTDETEIVIDDLAEVVAKSLPMPNMPTKPPKTRKPKK